MAKKVFEFESIEGLISWFFETVYDTLKEKYKSPFQLRLVMKTTRGIEKGLLANIKEFNKRRRIQCQPKKYQ